MIGIDRAAGARPLKDMARRAAEAVSAAVNSYFPEGTRRPVDAEPHYKSGIGMIYVDCGVTCCGCLNSGLFWAASHLHALPGTRWSNPRTAAAGPEPQGIQHPHCHRHRGRHQRLVEAAPREQANCSAGSEPGAKS